MAFYDFTAKKRDGEDFDFHALEGKAALVVNTATGCGFTPQYEGLEKLYAKYRDRGFEIIDFPCNQFAGQAPGTDEEIHQFCTLKYNTTFDQFAKVEVNGENAHPLFTWLKEQAPAEEVSGLKNKMAMKAIKKISKTAKSDYDIQWNFTKFLVDKTGAVVKRYAPTTSPDEIDADIAAII